MLKILASFMMGAGHLISAPSDPMECTVMDIAPKGVQIRCDDGTWLNVPRYSFDYEPAYEGQTVKMKWHDGQLHYFPEK